jgi:hypothetical protein
VLWRRIITNAVAELRMIITNAVAKLRMEAQAANAVAETEDGECGRQRP